MDGSAPIPLLWPLAEAARQLGGVHPRTVRRLIQSGALVGVKVGARLLVSSVSVRAYIDHLSPFCAKLCALKLETGRGTPCQDAVSEIPTAYTAAPIRRSGGSRTATDAAAQLAAVLAFPSRKTPRA